MLTTIQFENKIHSLPTGEEYLHSILNPCPCQPTTKNNCLLHHPVMSWHEHSLLEWQTQSWHHDEIWQLLAERDEPLWPPILPA